MDASVVGRCVELFVVRTSSRSQRDPFHCLVFVMSQSTAAPNKAAEVGWLFVPQYYTLMNSDPSRLHCFYTKKSTMVHASENEDATPNVGQQVSALPPTFRD